MTEDEEFEALEQRLNYKPTGKESKQTDALKLALEALKELRMLGMNAQWHDSWLAKSETAITALREALAEQPAQQEPVIDKSAAIRIATALGWEPRREWVGLTYGEVLEQKKDDPIQFYRAIEAKLREKNA